MNASDKSGNNGSKRYVSYSEIDEFNRCRFAHHLRYIDRIRLRMPDSRPLFGTAVHAGLAGWFRGEGIYKPIAEWYNAFDKNRFFEEEIETLDDIVGRAALITERTVEWLKGQGFDQRSVVYLDDDGIPLIEKELTVEMGVWNNTPFLYKGIVDAVLKNRHDGRLWCIDWKIREIFQPDDNEEVNWQAMLYGYMLRQNGINVTGTATVQISAKLPATPKLNKDGTMSRQKIKTDWDTYQQSLLDYGLNPIDYTDMQEALAGQEFFKFTPAYRSEKELQAAWNEAVYAAWGIIGNPSQWRVLKSYVCRGCWARELCLTDFRGGDTTYLLQTKYEQRSK